MNFKRFIRFNSYQIQMVVLLALLFVLILLFIKRRHNIAELKKEEERIDKKIYQKELLYKKRMKEFEIEKEKHRKQIEEYKKNVGKQYSSTDYGKP